MKSEFDTDTDSSNCTQPERNETKRNQTKRNETKPPQGRADWADPAAASVSFRSLVDGRARRTAALCFFELLVLQGSGHIELSQSRPTPDQLRTGEVTAAEFTCEDIVIRKGENLDLSSSRSRARGAEQGGQLVVAAR